MEAAKEKAAKGENNDEKSGDDKQGACALFAPRSERETSAMEPVIAVRYEPKIGMVYSFSTVACLVAFKMIH